jgi:hypothetical protein
MRAKLSPIGKMTRSALGNIPPAIYANLSDPAKQLERPLELSLTGIRARVRLATDDGRFYTDMDEEDLRGLFAPFSDMAVTDVWISTGESTHHGKDAWLNAIAIKLFAREKR